MRLWRGARDRGGSLDAAALAVGQRTLEYAGAKDDGEDHKNNHADEDDSNATQQELDLVIHDACFGLLAAVSFARRNVPYRHFEGRAGRGRLLGPAGAGLTPAACGPR
jgi:hypothetical protein